MIATEPRLALDDNVNLFGAPPAALRVLAAAGGRDLTDYPEVAADALSHSLADYAGVDPAEVVTGCGSDDVIDCAIRAFAREGERLVFPAPTFSMLPGFARNQRLVPVPVPLLANGDLDAGAMLAARPRVLYICAPNNPTGGTPGGIARLIAEAPGLVIVDEAYAEFAEAAAPGAARALLSRAPAIPRLLVVRTLSKAFGLAGLRVGYGTGGRELIERVAAVRGPYRIGRLAERAARAALAEDRGWMADRARDMVGERVAFAAALADAGFAPLHSDANFVLIPVRRAAGVAHAMAARGVIVRAFPALPAIGDAVRITIGPRTAMHAALDALVAAAS